MAIWHHQDGGNKKKKLKEMKEKKRKEKKKKKPSSSSKNDSSEIDVDVFSESELEEEMKSRKRKQILENSSSESKTESTDDQKEESLSDPAQQQIIIFRPSSQPLDIILIQLCLPSSQATSESPVPLFEPSPLTESTPEPQQVDESIPIMPPAPSKIDAAPEATAATLLMMARTASYVPKELHLPSFSLGLTDSSQEESQTQEGVAQAEAQVVKSPETTILIEELYVLVEKIAKSGEKKTPDFPEGKIPPTEKQTVG
ncbi:hypothetical protein Ahy_B03g066586 [Arachis hypogaea]|uniref:Uncharacterized protein n=1 Tax=Arachis hypogaea TaxID=3818 RepID=A0A445A4E6_ARAHY|nr:hypothetical protein Ahy_B03g066586 [Arachis hypogaea]